MTLDRERYGAGTPEGAAPSLAARIRLVGGVAALALLGLFFLQNLQEVDVHFLWFDWSIRLLWALLASAAIGAIATVLFATLRGRRERVR